MKFFHCFLLIVFIFGFYHIRAQQVFDVRNYEAEVEPDFSNKSVKGNVKISLVISADKTEEIKLNAGKLEIDSVVLGKKSLRFEKKDSVLVVKLPRLAKSGEKLQIAVNYQGVPPYGIKFFPAEKQIYTIFSTSQWMPCVDAPSDRATFRLRLILPKGLKTVGNGDFVREKNFGAGKIVSEWYQQNSVPTYLFGFAAGNFVEFSEKRRSINLRFLASPQFSETEIRKIFRDTADMLDFYEEKSGVKYQDKTYTQVLALENAQQEMSGFAALNEDYGRGVLEDEKKIWLGTHEFAHQWWGNMITNRDWTHFWLNEGIANFMSAAYIEHRFGRAEYLSEIERYKSSYEKVRSAGKDKSLVFESWNKPTREDRRLVYDKGAYVVHLLREELGEELFWKGIKEYSRKYWGKSVETKDFQTSMEEASSKNLSKFFDKYVYLKEN